jgi:RluA family pseudouridine synthase
MPKPLRHHRSDSLGRNLRLVYEDQHIVVVDKPVGMLSARIGQDANVASAFDLVRKHVTKFTPRQRTIDKDTRRRQNVAWIVHRLDKDVSGLMVFARSHDAYVKLKEDLAARRIVRRYAAVADGELPVDATGEAWHYIAGYLRDAGAGRRVEVLRDETAARSRDAEYAVTFYRTLVVGQGRSLLEVRLKSGRKHQIRAHLASLGHPIAGDKLYQPRAGKDGERSKRIMLHAAELRLNHPITGLAMSWTSPPPGLFTNHVGATASAWPETGPELIDNAPPEPAGHTTKDKPAKAKRHRDEDDDASDVSSRDASQKDEPDQGWNDVAEWYTNLVGGGASDHHEKVVLPGVKRLLGAKRGMTLLDVACGEGRLCRELAGMGVHCAGVDAARDLVLAAREQAKAIANGDRPEYYVGDARDLKAALRPRTTHTAFDLATCVLAMMNIDPLPPVTQGIAAHLKRGGALVVVLLHPAFRSPGLTAWGWDKDKREAKQYRRVDAYMSPAPREVVMNPGQAAHGKPPITTTTWHRPLQAYVKALAEAGFAIDALEEWTSHRKSDSGPRAAEENRARREIPMFMAIRAVKR